MAKSKKINGTSNKKSGIFDGFKQSIKKSVDNQIGTEGEKGFLIDKTPYHFTPSFIEHNGRVAAILRLYVRPSSNRRLTFHDVIQFIPTSTLDGVEIHLMSKDGIIKGDEKTKTIKKNASGSKRAIEETEKQEEKKNVSDNSMKEIRRSKIEDYNDYEYLLDSAEPLVYFRWMLLVIGDTREIVDEQISIINTILDQNHEGAQWDSLPAEQMTEYSHLFESLKPTIYEMTSTGSNYAGLSFAINSGLNDEDGDPIGMDALSLSGATAFFDFDKSTKTKAFISVPRSSYIPRYVHKDEFITPSTSSIIAQTAANHIVMSSKNNGARAHHLVLNDFTYMDENRYFTPSITKDIFKSYDVSKVSINPLEGFGDLENVVNIYSRLVSKIANIFDILLDFKMTNQEKSDVLAAIDAFYFNQHLWTANADIAPHKTRIVGIEDKDEYPRMGMLLNEFSSLSKSAEVNNRENKADRLDSLSSLLKQTMTNYMGVLGRSTKIENTNAAQVYYNFNNIETTTMKQVQLLNLLDYVIYTAKKGDVIVIHGFDQILARVAVMMLGSIEAAQKAGIRFIFAFDTMRSPNNAIGQMNDVFELQKSYYDDLDSDVNWSILGKALPNEIPLIQKALNQELGQTVVANLQNKSPNMVLVHRKVGAINNFIMFNPII